MTKAEDHIEMDYEGANHDDLVSTYEENFAQDAIERYRNRG